MGRPFAVWLTGLPASGKSTIAAELQRDLAAAGLAVEILESDALRRVLTPQPTYSLEERELFYRAIAYFASRLVAHGVSVIIDATGHRRRYRDLARSLIPHFLEVAIVCPLEVCEARDRKGTYRGGQAGTSTTVPGLQVAYEAPLHPELTIDSVITSAGPAAEVIVRALQDRGWLDQARALADRA